MRRLVLPALLVLGFAGPAELATAQQQQIDCKDPTSTVEINYCLEQDLKAADADLNRVYQAALRTVGKSDVMSPADREKWRESLRKAQRLWVSFRDADCRDPITYEWWGGTGTTGAILGCLVEKTRARTKDLQTRYEDR